MKFEGERKIKVTHKIISNKLPLRLSWEERVKEKKTGERKKIEKIKKQLKLKFSSPGGKNY